MYYPEKNERTLVTTLTKKMAEKLTKYLARIDIRCRYIHNDIDTIERVEVIGLEIRMQELCLMF